MSPAEMEQGWGMFLRISNLESFLSLKFLPQSFRYKKTENPALPDSPRIDFALAVTGLREA